MNSAICTLFEGDYHYGVGALVNSLYKHGFRGVVWAGYRGELPPWATKIKRCQGYEEFNVAEGCDIRFVPVGTKVHFTNYKPDFMLSLWEKYCSNVDSLFYFDPDICIKCRWSFYEEWVDCGVSVCEDINSPFLRTHPVRMMWQRLGESHNFSLRQQHDIYVNGGFIGVKKTQIQFLSVWSELNQIIENTLGVSNKITVADRTHTFSVPDQDAMNMALMFADVPFSILGKEGMDFIPGGYTMSHALGGPKPWRKRFVKKALTGFAPTMADKAFFANSDTPIELYSSMQRKQIGTDLRFGAAIGRFVKKN